MRACTQVFRLSLVIALAFLPGFLFSADEIHAESYIAAQLGITFPQPLSNVQTTGSGVTPGTTSSDLHLHESLIYGGKLGHYFDEVPWLGVETEVFTTTPHIKQQRITINEPGVGSGQTDFTGRDFRVTTWAFNLLARYPGKTLQPYAGLGMGINWAYLYDGQTGDTQNSSDVGLNALIGLRYLATERLFVFGEWKYNQASFSFADTARLTGQNVTYNAQHVVFGVGLRF